MTDDLTASVDDEVGAAERAVGYARMRVDHVRRQFMRKQAGASDVHAAEHALHEALRTLDRALEGS